MTKLLTKCLIKDNSNIGTDQYVCAVLLRNYVKLMTLHTSHKYGSLPLSIYVDVVKGFFLKQFFFTHQSNMGN